MGSFTFVGINGPYTGFVSLTPRSVERLHFARTDSFPYFANTRAVLFFLHFGGDCHAKTFLLGKLFQSLVKTYPTIDETIRSWPQLLFWKLFDSQFVFRCMESLAANNLVPLRPRLFKLKQLVTLTIDQPFQLPSRLIPFYVLGRATGNFASRCGPGNTTKRVGRESLPAWKVSWIRNFANN